MLIYPLGENSLHKQALLSSSRVLPHPFVSESRAWAGAEPAGEVKVVISWVFRLLVSSWFRTGSGLSPRWSNAGRCSCSATLCCSQPLQHVGRAPRPCPQGHVPATRLGCLAVQTGPVCAHPSILTGPYVQPVRSDEPKVIRPPLHSPCNSKFRGGDVYKSFQRDSGQKHMSLLESRESN